MAGLRYLLAHGARADGRSGSAAATALMTAVGRGGGACAAALVAAGAEVNARSARRATPLMWAAGHGDPRVLALLLARGADARATDRDGETALTWLVDRPARADRAGNEPLEAVELLVRAGVDPEARRADGKSASDLARDAGYCAVAARLGGGCAR